jgi:ABC-type multidrug transport system fused ATPase/permease subunit
MKTEADIVEAMERLMVGRTSFIIAHRPSLLRNCDVLLVVQNGNLRAVSSNLSAAWEGLTSGKQRSTLSEPA